MDTMTVDRALVGIGEGRLSSCSQALTPRPSPPDPLSRSSGTRTGEGEEEGDLAELVEGVHRMAHEALEALGIHDLGRVRKLLGRLERIY